MSVGGVRLAVWRPRRRGFFIGFMEMGRWPIFCLSKRVMRSAPGNLTELIAGVVGPMGYELVGVEYLSQGHGNGLLRIYIDHENGINVDDCAAVSHQVSGLLDVEDPIHEAYSLEVSSPGLDRPLFTREQFVRFIGEQVNLKLHEKVQGRRRLKGRLLQVEGEIVTVEVDGETFEVPFDVIDQARIVPQF